MYGFPEGSHFYFTEVSAVAKAVSAITNANPAVATATAHGFTAGQEILFASGWEDASDAVFRVDAPDADTFSLLGLDTTDLNLFPAGHGAGSAQVILPTDWVEVPQVLTIGSSGGDPKFTTVAPLAKRNEQSVPTGFGATSVALTLAHDAGDADYQKMVSISRARRTVAFKLTLANGAASYGYGYLSVNEMPKLSSQQVNQVTATFSLLGRSISYGVPTA
ncbi:phage tail tube protein [Paraburkholderia unamae]|uniref:Tail tube protein n=1 Tax=Paraburkholderia unamae TaxID=219649 RepID=A0ABX5KXL1_9BURK|nr:phage tail tube protein [Paraburkholderia unamae]PVX86479.1 tail tube protein [Paraburkholderia unamae]